MGLLEHGWGGRGVGPADGDHGAKHDLITQMQLHFQYTVDLNTNLLLAGR